MFHKVKDVRALPGLKLSVQFVDGVIKIYDISQLLEKLPIFKVLQDNEKLFYSVAVDVGGYGIIWDDEVDLSCDELWEHGEKVESPFEGLLSLADATNLWGLSESTLRKAISYGKLIPGVEVCKYGKQWVVSVEAMVREYGNPIKNAS